ncbi:hypothetical protein [Sphingobacterium sp.]|uniref:hypothetical protein n=1 Tax=Sphingobacterium sp. TaxID=341027 RepID=UPI002582AEDC|nr:hypothetical protein [Sphingobacterium sp.]WET67945.1 MAG: hypothetical protein P0Y57_19070 [Sphingobacterium sp.]
MIKKVLFIILMYTISFPVIAQNKYATTTDGKTVLLKSDGTWEYVKDRSTSSNINQFKSTSYLKILQMGNRDIYSYDNDA